MVKPFMDDDFILSSPTAKRLYHDFAAKMPIIDYHCHLSPQEIWENKTFQNLTEVWLNGDHYKWRLLRANGIEEEYITGNASDYDKFLAFARTLPQAIGNPVYHWSHLELKRYFGIEEALNEKTAPAIWEEVNRQLNSGKFGARDFITKSNVTVVCTTDDPVDSLEYHLKLREDTSFDVKVLPAFRPDKGIYINRPTFGPWLKQLAEVTGQTIASVQDLQSALRNRAEFFQTVGCSVSDHGLDTVLYVEATEEEVEAIFSKALHGESISEEEAAKYITHMLVFLGKLYSELGWVIQFHMNASRNNNSRQFAALGPDTGYDSINDKEMAGPLQQLLDALAREQPLPKTILYSLNPNDNYILATLMGSFQGDGVPGKMQLGSAWWFNDTKDGMLEQLRTLANTGLLGRFVGMLTDSRSFLSYTRHEYFRRILCDLIGDWVEKGEVPADFELLGNMVQDISYNNAKAYFGF